MNPVFLYGLPQAEVVTRETMLELFPNIRVVINSLLAHIDKWSANDVTAEIQAAEDLVDVEADEVALYGGYDTNDIRRWSLALGAILNAFNSNVTVTLANGDTEVRTAKSIFLAYYSPYIAPAP